ncbi:MAG: tetratricopeptide repeat protein [Pseudomonadota bacterium]
MSELLTEEEQVERLKQWWKENGRSIIVGVVVGLGLFGGWQGWQGYQRGQAEFGAAAYDGFRQTAASADVDATVAAEERLLQDFSSSTYADFTALDTARQLVNAGRLEDAAERLERVYRDGSSLALRELAGLRLVRVLMAEGKLDAASELLAEHSATALAGETALLRGDLARQQGDTARAREAYEQALQAGVADPEWVRLMMQDVAQLPAG